MGNIGSVADEFRVDDITKSVDIDDAWSGSDSGSDIVVGGEGGCTRKGPDSNKLLTTPRTKRWSLSTFSPPLQCAI